MSILRVRPEISFISFTQQTSLHTTHLRNRQSWRPLGPEYVETDGPVAVDVGVVDPRGECKFWRFEGVVGGEVDV